MTDTSNTGTIEDLFRSLGQVLNKGLYFLLATMYQIFFNVASAQLFENETIKNFYARIQLIIGVFMIFKLTISILQGIMDPDKFTNPKEGFGSIITRVIIALVMLTLIVPINIPNVENANSLEKYINNNGILFGALYSLQDRILTNNTLGRLILGTNDGMGDESTDQFETQNEKLVSSANVFATTILKGFFRINMLPEESRDSDDESLQSNWYCGNNLSDDNKKAIEAYTNLSTSTDTLLSDEMIYGDCEINDDILSTLANAASHIPVVGTFFENFGGESRYLFVFHWFPAIIVGIVFLVILVGFTVDIAIRSIKLSILRLLAPIPIISYIEPKSSKDGGMFSSWVSALTSTYLDLFLRLAIVYFVIFLVQDMIANGIIINEANGVIGFISCIFIWLGLFAFAKMAPKFIKDALGIKGSGMTNVGLGALLGGISMAAGKGGIKGFALGMLQGGQTAIDAAAQGKSTDLGGIWRQQSDAMAKIRTGDKDAHGGILGGLMDRLNYDVRENAAKKAGYSKENLAEADYNKSQRRKEMIDATNAYEDAQREYNESVSDYNNAQNDLNSFINSNPPRSESDFATTEDYRDWKKRMDTLLQEKQDAVNDARASADAALSAMHDARDAKQKAEKNFKTAESNATAIEDYRAKVYQVAPRAGDVTRTTYRSGYEYDPSTGYTSSAEPFNPMKGAPGEQGQTGSGSDDHVQYVDDQYPWT